MSVGINIAQSDVDNMVGGLSRDLNRLLENIQNVYSWYQTLGDSGLSNLPLGSRSVAWTSTERADLESALADLNKLASIYQGGQTLATAYDFRTFAKLLYGFGF